MIAHKSKTALFAAIFAMSIFSDLAFAAPKISSPEPVYNFGSRPNTETVPHEFIIKNEGDETLEISDVKTSCGCTVAVPEKKTLLSGEETKINATLKLSGEGPRTKDINVFSNDPTTPQFVLKYEGNAVAPIKFEPPSLDFGHIMDGETHELKMKVFTEMPDISFKILNLRFNQDFLEASFAPLEDGKSYEITIKNSKPFPIGRLAAQLSIETDSELLKVINVYIAGQVTGDYWVQPDVLRIRYDETPGKVINGFVRVSPGSVKTFKIIDSIKPVDTMTVELEQQGDAYLVRLQNMPVDNTLNDKKLILKTDVAGHEEIVLPITVIPQQPAIGATPAPAAAPAPAVSVVPTPAPAPAPTAEVTPAPAN